MKKRTMLTADKLVEIWRLRYTNAMSFPAIDKKLGTTNSYPAYKKMQEYLHGDVHGHKNHVYMEAIKQIVQIIDEEIMNTAPAPATEVSAPADIGTIPVAGPYSRLAAAMQELEKAIDAVIEYNAEKQKEQITKVMEEAKYDNWSENLRKKYAGA
jgi:hypothetical protein